MLTMFFRKLKKRRSDGSLFVDAAISLPAFVIAFVFFILLIRLCRIEETVVCDMVSESHLQEIPSLQTIVTSLADVPGLSWDLDLDSEESSLELIPLSHIHYNFRYGSLYPDRDTSWDMVLDGDKKWNEGAKAYVKVLCYRPFLGESDWKLGENSETVYIFPNSGKKYHKAGCQYLKGGSCCKTLNQSLRYRYAPCQICKPQSLANGSKVWIYSEGSRTYHRKDCATITKRYEKTDKAHAQAQGYTPCSVCFNEVKTKTR